jgi:hypothetical protein
VGRRRSVHRFREAAVRAQEPEEGLGRGGVPLEHGGHVAGRDEFLLFVTAARRGELVK